MKINSIAQSSMKSLKKLARRLTLATLAMAVPQPAKADTVSIAVDAINVVEAVVFNYGTIKWVYTQQK